MPGQLDNGNGVEICKMTVTSFDLSLFVHLPILYEQTIQASVFHIVYYVWELVHKRDLLDSLTDLDRA